MNHAPTCTANPCVMKACRGCGVLIPRGRPSYCAPCREQECPECSRRGGRHAARCLYLQRGRNAPCSNVGDVEDAALERLLDHWPRAVRLARHIAGDVFAEDIASSALTQLVEHRQALKRPPDLPMLLLVVRWRAVSWVRGGGHRSTWSTEGRGLVDLEHMMAGIMNGRRPTTSPLVVLPIYTCPSCAVVSEPGPGGRSRYCWRCLTDTASRCPACATLGVDANCRHPALTDADSGLSEHPRDR